jgi:pimeloyl-ACP methyl ester carboxylesterase
MSSPDLQLAYAVIAGHRYAYLHGGTGPAVVLLHGLADDSRTWRPVAEMLAETHTVVAPDLLGAGQSDKPRTEYGVASHVDRVRALLDELKLETAVVVGHSFGGTIASELARQHPDRISGLVLVASGGWGREVTFGVRAATLPGFGAFMRLGNMPGIRHAVLAGMRLAARVPIRAMADAAAFAPIFRSFGDTSTLRAFRQVARSAFDLRGQVSYANDDDSFPAIDTAIVWGRRDTNHPVTHAQRAASVTGAKIVEIFSEAGHYPHTEEPARFMNVLNGFLKGRPAA